MLLLVGPHTHSRITLMAESDEDEALDIFREPDDFYEKEKAPTQVQHRTLDGKTLLLNLIGSSPLWGHLLWQGGRTIADFLENDKHDLVQDKTVLELGAGAGLPSIICAINGARQVVTTDYPDVELIENLQANVQTCTSSEDIRALGYLWGAEPAGLKAQLPLDERDAGFDLLIMADLLFNHSEHGKLLLTVQKTLKKAAGAQALVFFTPYRPWLLGKDLAFFELARNAGFTVEKILEKLLDKVMFEHDRGDEVLRRTVFGYRLKWSKLSLQSD